jgi:hypothetical protein
MTIRKGTAIRILVIASVVGVAVLLVIFGDTTHAPQTPPTGPRTSQTPQTIAGTLTRDSAFSELMFSASQTLSKTRGATDTPDKRCGW